MEKLVDLERDDTYQTIKQVPTLGEEFRREKLFSKRPVDENKAKGPD